ncbi:MAG: DinB family protein [Planctomycetes bacterium]|nr:DinB family protein [Planctomycetota bacterium]
MGTIHQNLLPELDQEWATTRRLVAVAPPAKTDWRPHPKSMSLGDLVTHLANIPTWVPLTLMATELDLAPPGGPPWVPPKFTSGQDALKTLDANVQGARACILAASAADWSVPWTLKKGGVALFTLPRAACIRSFVMGHMVHHRGQLSVYLRLCDVPVPAVYGPTADERF